MFFFQSANPSIAQRIRRGSLKSTGLFGGGGGGNNAQTQQQHQTSTNMGAQQPTLNHSTITSNNNTNITNTTMLANATSSKQRTFFKKRRQFTTSRSTDSESEETVEINPVNNRFQNVDSSVDDFYRDDLKSISSERDLLYSYNSPSGCNFERQLSPQYSHVDIWSSDDDDDFDDGDVVSIQSFNSDRKRKRVCTRIVNNATRDGLEQFV